MEEKKSPYFHNKKRLKYLLPLSMKKKKAKRNDRGKGKIIMQAKIAREETHYHFLRAFFGSISSRAPLFSSSHS
ncbi:MAG: hypothetical protein LGB53_00400 [Sulfurovum sp.]|nr:hypothetical protein [Sulfurovum sp.]